MITITAFPRLHVALIGMNDSGYRINGGIGFSIKKPTIVIKAAVAPSFEISDVRESKLDSYQKIRLKKVINQAKESYGLKNNVSIMIDGEMPTNMGFGSGTIIRLACLEALFILNSKAYTEDDLVYLSRRGNTSGIGIRTYFHGGYVMDIGHKSGLVAPSNSLENESRKSLLIEHGKMPNWNIGVGIPKDIGRLNQKEERHFFNKTIPISNSSVYEILYHVLYGVYSSLKEDDLETFGNAIENIQNCTWKSAEWNLYGSALKSHKNFLKRNGISSIGMSSLGPSLYFVSKNYSSLFDNVVKSKFANRLKLISTKANNRGRIIRLC